MKEFELIRIRAAVDSLTDSTKVRFHLPDMTVTVSGRCSPLISHRQVEYDVSSIPSTVIWENIQVMAENGGHALAVLYCNPKYRETIFPDLDPQPVYYYQDSEDQVRLAAREPQIYLIPAIELQSLMAEIRRWTGVQYAFGPMAWVAVWMPVFTGFDNQGHPTYREYYEREEEREREVGDV